MSFNLDNISQTVTINPNIIKEIETPNIPSNIVYPPSNNNDITPTIVRNTAMNFDIMSSRKRKRDCSPSNS